MRRNLPATLAAVILLVVAAAAPSFGQQSPSGNNGAPRIFDTYTPGPCSPNGQPHGGCPPGTQHRIRVVTLATGLDRPWHIAFLPDGKGMLVTETPGRLRMI